MKYYKEEKKCTVTVLETTNCETRRAKTFDIEGGDRDEFIAMLKSDIAFRNIISPQIQDRTLKLVITDYKRRSPKILYLSKFDLDDFDTMLDGALNRSEGGAF